MVRRAWDAPEMVDQVSAMLARAEERRRDVSAQLDPKHRARLGQFFTPPPTAAFLAQLLDLPDTGRFRLLDPGAGIGSLSAAVAARVISERPGLALEITAFELDPALHDPLEATLADCRESGRLLGVDVSYEAHHADFVAHASDWLLASPRLHDAVISNPPYRKVAATAPERLAASARGLQASNLYTIFAGLAADLLADGGQMSLIIPRSWANGPYHRPFRRFLLERVGIEFLHVYEARGRVFADADVLQENVVLHGRRGAKPPVVVLSTDGPGGAARSERAVPACEVVDPADPHLFVRIPTAPEATWVSEQIADMPSSLAELGLDVSTGRVVDFRAREWLRADPAPDTVPLIYPAHLSEGRVFWPLPGSKKPNAIVGPNETAKLMLPNETYVLVKRFSAKEERRRVFAAVLRPDDLPSTTTAVGVENHLNFFHARGRGLEPEIALGLCGYLNSTLVDEYVRIFSGHTQINATDLRQLRYPAARTLRGLGAALAAHDGWPDQVELDAMVALHISSELRPALQAA